MAMIKKLNASILILVLTNITTLYAQQATIWPSQIISTTNDAVTTIWPTAWNPSKPNTPYYYYPKTNHTYNDIKAQNQIITEAPYSDKWEYYCYPTYNNWGYLNYAYQNRNAYHYNYNMYQPTIPSSTSSIYASPYQTIDQQNKTTTIDYYAELKKLKKQHESLLMESTKTMEIQAKKIDELRVALEKANMENSKKIESQLKEVDELRTALENSNKEKVALQKQLDEALSQANDTSELDTCLSNLDNEKKKSELSLNTMKQQLLALKNEVNKTKQALVEATQDSDELRIALENSNKEKVALQKQLDEALSQANDTSELDACLSNLDNEKKKSESSLNTMKQQLLVLKNEVNKTKRALVEATQDSDYDGVIDKQDQCPNTPENTMVDTTGCVADRDQDGITDDKDQCPDTPSGAKVNASGCELDSDKDGIVDSKDQCPDTPEGEHVDDTGCVFDSDNDGVTDGKDKCPNTPKNVKVNLSGCELDTDKDGIVDSKDQCPSSPEGSKVDETGCVADKDQDGIIDDKDQCLDTPSGAKVNASGCELDSDKDGIVDSKDQCPDTLKEERVDERGCIVPDNDKDGISDENDLCPDTNINEQVNEVGCSVTETINLTGVNFETGSANLTQDSYPILDKAATILLKYPILKIEVGGHTDNTGSQIANKRLSQKRAEAVMQYLISKGIKAENLSAKGYGFSQPIADNNTSEGRAKNRRVELKIVKEN